MPSTARSPNTIDPMALQKSLTLPNVSVPGSYLRIGYVRLDYLAREASAHFDLFESRAARLKAPNLPMRPRAAKLRLTGNKFDQYLSGAAIAAAGASANHLSQLYAAAKAEPGSVTSDWNSVDGQGHLVTIFAGAQDVLEAPQAPG